LRSLGTGNITTANPKVILFGTTMTLQTFDGSIGVPGASLAINSKNLNVNAGVDGVSLIDSATTVTLLSASAGTTFSLSTPGSINTAGTAAITAPGGVSLKSGKGGIGTAGNLRINTGSLSVVSSSQAHILNVGTSALNLVNPSFLGTLGGIFTLSSAADVN